MIASKLFLVFHFSVFSFHLGYITFSLGPDFFSPMSLYHFPNRWSVYYMEADFVSFTAVWRVRNRSLRDAPLFLHCPPFAVINSTVPSIEIVDETILR